jgi:hypothetical protein
LTTADRCFSSVAYHSFWLEALHYSFPPTDIFCLMRFIIGMTAEQSYARELSDFERVQKNT